MSDNVQTAAPQASAHSMPKPQPVSQSSAPSPIPRFIQSQLAHPPIGPNEDPVEFRDLFFELAAAVQDVQRSAADYAMLFQVTTLAFRVVALERIRSTLVPHMRPEAVVSLLRLADGVVERGSLASFEVNDRRKEFFANKEGKAKIEALFARHGYTPEAVEIEAFQLALPSLALIDRQINAAQKQFMAFLKEIDRRDAKRAEELRQATVVAVLRAQSEAAGKREAN